jgi:hypothetical protein
MRPGEEIEEGNTYDDVKRLTLSCLSPNSTGLIFHRSL